MNNKNNSLITCSYIGLFVSYRKGIKQIKTGTCRKDITSVKMLKQIEDFFVVLYF
jgi:hypothetical protein